MQARSILFVASKLFGGSRSLAAARLLRLSLLGIALSVAVVIMALSIILGFKGQVSDLAYRQTGQLSLYRYGTPWTGTANFISVPQSVKDYLKKQDEIEEIQPIIQQMAMLKTEDDFLGLALYGVEPEHRIEVNTKGVEDSIRSYQIGGADSVGNPIVLPSVVAEKMSLSIGDKLRLYFTLDGKIKVRSFYLAHTYETAGLEQMPALCSASLLRRLLNLSDDEYSRIIIRTTSGEELRALAGKLSQRFSTQTEVKMQDYAMSTADEMLPDLFSWLELLDSNVIFLIVIIIIISTFTMITGIIILVLDKVNHIAVIKALGGSNSLLQRLFALIAIRLIAGGLVLGNVLAFVLLAVQHYYAPLRLNPQDYFIDRVPVLLDPMLFVWVSFVALLVVALAIVLPLRTIQGIRPSLILRFE